VERRWDWKRWWDRWVCLSRPSAWPRTRPQSPKPLSHCTPQCLVQPLKVLTMIGKDPCHRNFSGRLRGCGFHLEASCLIHDFWRCPLPLQLSPLRREEAGLQGGMRQLGSLAHDWRREASTLSRGPTAAAFCWPCSSATVNERPQGGANEKAATVAWVTLAAATHDLAAGAAEADRLESRDRRASAEDGEVQEEHNALKGHSTHTIYSVSTGLFLEMSANLLNRRGPAKTNTPKRPRPE